MLSTAGDLASVLGFPLALIGVMITLWEARRAREAAEGARRAADEALSRIKARLLAGRFAGALRALRELDRTCRKGEWDAAVLKCEVAIDVLARHGRSVHLTPEEREALGRMIACLGEVRAYATKLAERPRGRAAFPERLQRQVYEIRVELIRVRGRLEDSSMEV